jgi:hypothetical protein
LSEKEKKREFRNPRSPGKPRNLSCLQDVQTLDLLGGKNLLDSEAKRKKGTSQQLLRRQEAAAEGRKKESLDQILSGCNDFPKEG